MKNKYFSVCAGLACASLLVTGCASGSDTAATTAASTTAAVASETTAESSSDAEETTVAEETTAEESRPELPTAPADGMEDLVYEAEDAEFTGSAFAGTDSSCSGGGYADGLYNAASDDQEADTITFKVTVPYDYYYDLTFLASSGGSEKYNYVSLDGTEVCELLTDSKDYTDCSVDHVYMTAGDHDITLSTYWGYTKYDKLTISLGTDNDQSIYDVSADLINPNASDNARRVMKYLTDVYGEYILTGQYSDNGYAGLENQSIFLNTGKYPAVLGLDLIECSPSRVAHGSTSVAVDEAIDWWSRGGIVTMCWHWNAPEKYLTGEWYNGFRKEGTNINLKKIMDGEDEEGYQLLLDDIGAIAAELQKLEDADVPVIWRPLHEASGGWFWWGASGADAYKELWKLMYDQLTNVYGLDNLIWLWNGQDAEWYPGDEYVDIIGEDIYPGYDVDSSQVTKFLEAVNYTENHKLVVLSENGCVPDPEKCYIDGAMWGFYCTWSGEFVLKSTSLNKYTEKYTTLETLKKMYDSPLSITLDELPDLTTYPLD